MRNLAVGFAVGSVVGGASAYFLLKVPERGNVGWQQSSSIQYHPALKYGPPIHGGASQNMKFHDGFVAAFDSRTRNPSWVLEYLEWKDKYDDGVDRSKSEFFEDEGINVKFRNRLSDFKGSGYDRGHLAPAANHKSSQKAMDETFTLSNISPQVGKGFNRGYWARFEKFVKDLMKSSQGVYVVTGPLWLPKRDSKTKKWRMEYPMIGEPPRLVSVPTHFYKVILVEKKNGHQKSVGAFVLPNEEIDPGTPLTRFSTPIGDLECVTGIKFFPDYLTEDRLATLDAVAKEWREYGIAKQLEGGGKGTSKLKSSQKGGEESEGETDLAQGGDMQHGSGGSKSRRKFPKTGFGGGGAVHLCENTGCHVAAEEFWVKKPQK